MPKLAFHIEADYQKVIKLREEIDKLKSTIAGMDSNTKVLKRKYSMLRKL